MSEGDVLTHSAGLRKLNPRPAMGKSQNNPIHTAKPSKMHALEAPVFFWRQGGQR